MQYIQVFINAISSVGFPIVACGAMFYLNYKTTQAINDLSKTVALNTEAINDLRDKIK